MSQWLTIVGVGEDGWQGLCPAARLAIEQARVVIGSTRLLEHMPELSARIEIWPQPFSAVVQQIKPFRGQPTVILATGDPLNYGVARKLLTFIPKEEVTIIPGLSAFSLACARMGWSLPDCDCLTLHGRAASHIEPFIQPDVRLLVLTADARTIADVCQRLVRRGFGQSHVTVLENMGGVKEKRQTFSASDSVDSHFSDLNTLAIHCIASPTAKIFSRLAGLPDEAFLHDGQLTKREVRAATLAALCPGPEQILWDIGAGCGSVAIEWMRSSRSALACAFETRPERCTMIAQNAEILGTPRLQLITGMVPDCLGAQPAPDAIFIGGGLTTPSLFEALWHRLKPAGRLVANVVTIEGEQRLYELQAQHGGELLRMEVSHLTQVGPYRALKPRMAVTQWRTVKPW